MPGRVALVAGALAAAVAGLALSAWTSSSRTCTTAARIDGPWSCDAPSFDPWWGFWVSSAGAAITVAGVLLARRSRRRCALGLTMVAAAVAVAPVSLDVLLAR